MPTCLRFLNKARKQLRSKRNRPSPSGEGRNGLLSHRTALEVQKLEVQKNECVFKQFQQLLTEKIMSRESRMLAGILLVVLPSVMYGGLTLLSLLTRICPGITTIRCDTIFREPDTHMLAFISSCRWSCFGTLTRQCFRRFGSGLPEPARRSLPF